jgi:DNA-binding SARP family transcriptional activator
VGQANGAQADPDVAFGLAGLGAGAGLGSLLLAELQVIRCEVHELSEALLHRGGDFGAGPRAGATDTASADHGLPPLYATFFGRFAIFRAGERLHLGQSRAVVELCRYLIARSGEPVQREEIIELLWPDAEPERALHRLHVAVSGLRRILDAPGAVKSVIQLEDERYTIADEAITTDCALFEARYREGRTLLSRPDGATGAASLRAALSLYRGDYLSDQCYAEWTHQARAHFMERRLSALTLLTEYAANSGDLAGVLEHATEILEIDGLRERAHRHLMRAHLALGQRACAIRQYQTCTELLEQELGVEPSRLTRQLYEAIRVDSELPPEVRLLD